MEFRLVGFGSSGVFLRGVQEPRFFGLEPKLGIPVRVARHCSSMYDPTAHVGIPASNWLAKQAPCFVSQRFRA